MNKLLFIEAIGYLDTNILAEHMIEKENIKNKPTKKHVKKTLVRSIIVAGLVVTIMCSFFIYKNLLKNHIIEPISNNTVATQINVETGVYLNNKIYMLDINLSQQATEKNIGNFVGYLSDNQKKISEICAFDYVPNKDDVNRIIFFYQEKYYVFNFSSYVSDESDTWPISLLTNAKKFEIRDPNYGISNDAIYNTSYTKNDIIDFLSGLVGKHNQQDLNNYYYKKFATQFNNEEIWINESGSIAHSGNATVISKFYDMVYGEARILVITMEDNTWLNYLYLEGAGVVVCEDFGYILSDNEIAQFNKLLGIK